MSGTGALVNIKAHANRGWWPGKNRRCLMPVGYRTKHMWPNAWSFGAFGWGEGSHT